MISPELLRHYPFFGSLNSHQLNEVAMIADEEIYESGEVIFHEGETADAVYFLLEGSIDLYYAIADTKYATLEKGIPVGEINPGEPFGISGLIEPHLLTSTARSSGTSRAIHIDAVALRALLEKDRKMAYLFINQAAKAAIERLKMTRIQLATA